MDKELEEKLLNVSEERKLRTGTYMSKSTDIFERKTCAREVWHGYV